MASASSPSFAPELLQRVRATDPLRAKHLVRALDHAGAPVFLARNSWHLDTAKKDWPKVRFLEVKEQAWNS
jgi:peptide subunit release factor RF-3